MKSALRKGQLPLPISLSTAKSRHQQLVYEVQKIERQLKDENRKLRLGVDYESWATRAKTALQYMKKELEELSRWLDRHPDSDLFRDAYSVLKRLQEEVDLEPEEEAVIQRLDAYFECEVEKKDEKKDAYKNESEQ